MTPIFLLTRGLFVVLSFALLANARAADWPQGYIVHEGSASPDGHFGIAVPTFDAEDSGTGEDTNYLADLTTHKLLGAIACETYFEGKNHASLKVLWEPDSKCCVVLYEARFSYDAFALLTPKASGFSETNLTDRVEKALATAAGDEGYGAVYFRFSPDRKLLVRALYFTGNPKMNDEKTHYARFEGTFDPSTGTWTKAKALRMVWPKPDAEQGEAYSDAYEAVDTAYASDAGDNIWVTADGNVPDDFQGDIVATYKDKADELDDTMNQVYQGVRAILPAEQFAKVKKEQIAWLKKRDAVSGWTEKCKFVEARIKALQNLLW